tara:strand:- start:1217 stop:1660 length:444 start_codon:yes stop_codon:yes gene_type:complete
MDIILLKDFDGLGQAGDVVSVKPGFARNKLIPEGIALRASKRNLAISDERKSNAQSRLIREEAANEALVKKISKVEITIEAQVGEEDKMFGSITSADIQKALKDKGVDVARQTILLKEPLKALGIYHVPVRVASNMNADVKIYVIKS